MAGQLARVKVRTRPWRAIIALALAIAAAVAARFWGHRLMVSGHRLGEVITYCGAGVFFVLGLMAVFELTGKARDRLRPVIGSAHAGVMRYALALIGVFVLLLIAFDLAQVPVAQLLVGGAVTGVLLGIAAQQSLANLFAGLVLLFARPFRVGQRVRFRSGALGGVVEGEVTDISLTYVRVETADGDMLLPNSQVLAAVIGTVPAANPVLARGDDAVLTRGDAPPERPLSRSLGPRGPSRRLVLGFVLGDDLGRDAATVVDLDAAALGPRPDRGAATPVCRGPALGAHDQGRRPARLAGKALQCLVELLAVLLAEVDFIVTTAETERPHERLARRDLPCVVVAGERNRDLLCHL